MADLERLYSALRQADAAGNVEDATKLANYIRQQQQAPQPDSLGRYVAGPAPEPQQETKTSNPFTGLAGRAADVVGNTVEGIARVAENLGDKLETAIPLTNLTPEQIQQENQLQPLFDFSKSLKNWSKDLGYAPSIQLGELTSNPLKAVPFIVERVIASSPDMVAAVAAAPAYLVSRTNEILNDRLENDNKPLEKATAADVAAATGAAILETYLERFATKRLLPGGGFTGATAGKRIGKETALQSGTEAVEEGIGYLGGAAGTEKGIDPYQMAQQMIEGAIVGGGLGAGVQGGKEYVSRPRVNDGTSESGLSGDSTKGEAPGGTRRLDKEGLDVLSKRLGALDKREGELNDQLIELQNQQAQVINFDPNDPRAGEIESTIKELKTELRDVVQEKKNTAEIIQTAEETPVEGKEKAFNAPGLEEQKTEAPKLVKNGHKVDLVQDGEVLQSFETMPEKLYNAFKNNPQALANVERDNANYEEANNALEKATTAWQETQPYSRMEKMHIADSNTFFNLVDKVTNGTATPEEQQAFNMAELGLKRRSPEDYRRSLRFEQYTENSKAKFAKLQQEVNNGLSSEQIAEQYKGKPRAMNAPGKPEFTKVGDAIVYDKGAFIKGDTKDDLMKASANFTEIVPSNSLYESFYEDFPQFPKGSMDGAVFVHGINVNGKRGTGLGKQILDATLQWADQKGKAIFLIPAAQPDAALGGLTQEQLRQWYARNGFEDHVDYMIRPAQKAKVMNAPGQEGFAFGEADENTQRTLSSEPTEFGLTAPEGSTGVTTKAEPIKAVDYATSKMMLVNTGVNPVKNLISFFKSLKPAAVSENEVKAFNAEIDKVIEEINAFQEDAKGLDRTKRLNFLRDFIDKFSTAPESKQSQMSRLPSVLTGMNAEEQQNLLSDISQFPKLNTVRGMKEFRGQLQEAMLDYTEAKLGRSRESAILPWETHEDVSTEKDAAELKRLGNISEKYLTPEEKAAKNYLTAHAPADQPFGNALRAAAFDLGADQGPVYPGQTKETAQLFRSWLAKNMHPSTLARFDATVEEYRKMAEKINKRLAEKEAGEKNVGWRAWNRGGPKIMHPSVESRIANNDLKGALRALSKLGTPWQQGLAKKLLSLNLTTTIGFDKQEEFAHRLVDQNVGIVRTQLFGKLEEEFPSVFKQHFASLSDIRALQKALTALKNGKLGVPKATVDAIIGQVEIVEEAYVVAVSVLDAAGTYFPHADALTLNRNRGGNTHNTFLHEVLHAATHWMLDPLNYDSLSAEQKQAVDELQRTYEIAKGLWGSGNEISSIDEFVVEAFTNPEFQRFLKDIPMPNQKKTVWNKFTDVIRDMFGLSNMLGYTLANANTILQAAPSLSAEVRALNQQGKLGGYILDDTFKAGPSARSFINNVFAGKVKWSDVKENMPTFLENAKDSTRKHLLGALTLRQLQDLVGPRVAAFKDFIDSMEAMLDERNAMLNKTRDIVKPWMEFQSKFKKKAETLNKLMLDATRLGIDPDTNTSDARLNQAWNDIGETGQNIYRLVRNFYKNQLDAHIKVLLDRKANALKAKGLSEAEAVASQEYKDLEAHFRENTLEPYFPIRRFGEYWLQVGKGKSKEFYMFESAGERNKFQKQREKQLATLGQSPEIASGNSIKNLINENIQDFEFLAKLKTLIQTETGNTRKELKDNILESVEQMYLQTLPDQNIRKMFMNRQGIQGMNQDMLRAFTASAFRISYQQSRLAHSDSLYKAIDGAEKNLEGMPTDEKKLYGDYIGELQKRLQYIMNPPDTGKIPSVLSNMSFIWYMTSPASAVVNMLGVPAVGIPVVGAKFGNAATAKTMANYARKFMTTGFLKDGKPAFPSFANKSDIFNDRQKAAFDKFIADGLIDITLTHDIVGLSETDSNLYTGRMQKVMQVLSAAFHGAEKFNREVVAMSAYDLSYAKNIKPVSEGGLGLSPDAAQKRAIEEAKELTYKSMFDYSALNKPRYFQGKYAKVFLQFKQFSQQMTYMLARSAYEGFAKKFDANDRKDIGGQINTTRLGDGQESLDGKDLEEAIDKYIKEFRTEGKKRLMGTLGTTFIFAGATGLPGWAAFSTMMEILHYVFADEEEEDKPFDFDNWFKNWSAETFGGFYGDSLSRGIVSQATGVDLADRMGLNDMWFRDQRKQPDMESAFQAYLVSLMGPAIGIAVNGFNAYDQLSQGHIGRAIETASPALIKNGLKAARLEREGALTLSGDELIPDFSAVEIAAQAAGFQPERLAQKQKANIEEKNMEQEIIHKHDMLLNAMFLAIDTKDDALFDRTVDKISRFNTSNPGMAITGKNIQDSIKRRYKLRAEAIGTGGVKINKKLRGQLGEANEYGSVE
jgi:hypothetical protein